MKIKVFCLIVIINALIGCETQNNYLSPIRKNIEPKELVSKLRNGDLFYKIKGYGIRPRDERFGVYLISREEDKGIIHWVNYNPNGTKYSKFHDSYINEDSILVKITDEDKSKILKKANELVGILKDLDIRWAVWEFGRFDCYFNDSTRMTYVENESKLDSTFYRYHKNLNWIDSNFVTYEFR